MGGSNGHRRQLFPCARPAMPDTNRRRTCRHLRISVRATRQIPINARPPLGHPEDWSGGHAHTFAKNASVLDTRVQVQAKRHKVEAKKDSVTAQERPAKQSRHLRRGGALQAASGDRRRKAITFLDLLRFLPFRRPSVPELCLPVLRAIFRI